MSSVYPCASLSPSFWYSLCSGFLACSSQGSDHPSVEKNTVQSFIRNDIDALVFAVRKKDPDIVDLDFPGHVPTPPLGRSYPVLIEIGRIFLDLLESGLFFDGSSDVLCRGRGISGYLVGNRPIGKMALAYFH